MRKILALSLLGAVLLFASGLAFMRARANTPNSVDEAASLPSTIPGFVYANQKPVAGAIVQVQAKPKQITTAQDGSFTLQGIGGTKTITVTAWSEGYYIGWVKLDPQAPNYQPTQVISITLKPHYTTDNDKYSWFSFEGVKGSASCGLCHREYPEWQGDAHSQAAVNPRFITLYRGTDVDGNKGQPTRYGSDGKVLPADPAKPDYGPGYKLDNPERNGNCAACHTPVAAKISNQKNCGWSGCHKDITSERSTNVMDGGVSPLHTTGDAAEGITCDFCHKIGDVLLDPKTNLPYADMPGILSYRLYRPEEGQQLFFGTLIDMPRRDTYLPLLEESEYCAGCHYGVFGGIVGNGSVTGGVVIYNSYGEWLESPYSDPATGKTCQQCHMPVTDANFTVFPARGGVQRDYAEFHDHAMPGAADEGLLQNSVTLQGASQHSGNQLKVTVSVTNDKTGHHVPTDAPLREMILIVEAVDATGAPLSLKQGSVLPAWSGNFADLPGKTYSKILRDDWSGTTPTAAYWRPVTIVQDTRLAALATDTTTYTFTLPAGQSARVNIRLVFRRAFQALAEQKGWTDPDILMEELKINEPGK